MHMHKAPETEIQKIMDLENRLVVVKGEGGEGEGEGGGWMGCLGLTDADDCLWNGSAMSSCWVALGAMSSHLG